MAAVVTTPRAFLGLTVGSRLNHFAETLRSWNNARLTGKALNRLSERELSDIGLTRADVDAI